MPAPQEQAFLGFIFRHLATGLAAGAAFGIAILAADFAGLRGLVFSSEQPWLALALLFFGLFITFGSVAVGASIMLLKRDRHDS